MELPTDDLKPYDLRIDDLKVETDVLESVKQSAHGMMQRLAEIMPYQSHSAGKVEQKPLRKPLRGKSGGNSGRRKI